MDNEQLTALLERLSKLELIMYNAGSLASFAGSMPRDLEDFKNRWRCIVLHWKLVEDVQTNSQGGRDAVRFR